MRVAIVTSRRSVPVSPREINRLPSSPAGAGRQETGKGVGPVPRSPACHYQRFDDEDFAGAGAGPASVPRFAGVPGAPTGAPFGCSADCLPTAVPGTVVLPAAGPDVTPGEVEELSFVAACAIGAAASASARMPAVRPALLQHVLISLSPVLVVSQNAGGRMGFVDAKTLRGPVRS